MGGIVIDDRVDRLWLGNVRVDAIKEADELLMAMALHVVANNGAVEHVERGEQRGGAVAFVVVGHRPASGDLGIFRLNYTTSYMEMRGKAPSVRPTQRILCCLWDCPSPISQ